ELLEGTINGPEKKDDPAKTDETRSPEGIQPYEVFSRPPKGISTTPQPAGPNAHRLPATPGSQGAFQEVQLIVAKGKGKDAFRTDALKELGAGNRAEDKTLTPPGRQLVFEQYRSDATGPAVFVYHDEAFQAAVGFRSTKPDPAAVDFSLGSLALGR